jgi:uncharacterized membrane protein
MAPADESGISAMGASVSVSSLDVHIQQTRQKKGKWTVGGGGAGLVVGLLIGGPILGLAAGLAVGAIAGSMKDYGIEDSFIRDISDHLAPDSSALFILGEALDQEALLEHLRPFNAELLRSSLPAEQEQRLRMAVSGR